MNIYLFFEHEHNIIKYGNNSEYTSVKFSLAVSRKNAIFSLLVPSV